MRLLLVALLSTASVFCSAQGVIYIDDIDSLPKSVLETPTLPGSLNERTVAPHSPIRYTAPAGDEIQLTAAHTYNQTRNQPYNSKPQAIQKSAKKSSFFAKMKPTWLFGDDEKNEAPKDPFLAHTPSNKEVFRNQVAPIATYEASDQSSVKNAAYSNSKFTRPSFGHSQSAPTEIQNQATTNNSKSAAQKPRLKNTPSSPRQGGGIAMRRESQPKGLLNHLGWMNDKEETSKPASKKSLPRPEKPQALAQGPTPVFVESKQTTPKAAKSSSNRMLSASSHGVAGFGTPEATASEVIELDQEEAIFASDMADEKKTDVLEIIEETKSVEQPKEEATLASDENTKEPAELEEPQDGEATFVESNEPLIAETHAVEPNASQLAREKMDPLAILEREIVQPALEPKPVAKTSTEEPKVTESNAEPVVEPSIAVNPIDEKPLPTPTIETQPVQLPVVQTQQVKTERTPTSALVQQAKTAEPLPIPSAAYTPKPIVTHVAPSIKPTQNPFVQSRAIVDPNKEPTERSRILLSEAHGLAQDAKNIEQYTAIVQRCRYVLAIDDAPIAVDYANELASWALNKRGEDLLDQGRNAEATVDFNDAIHCNADCWRAIHNLGVLQAQSGDYESAALHFNKALALNPEYAKAYANRAALQVQSANYQQALEDYQRAIQIDPDLAMAHSGRGRVCHMLGYLEQALRHLDAAQLLTPSDATICLGRGDLLVDLGRYGQARQAYEQAIEIEPNSANAYRNLAWMQATCPSNTFRNGEEALANALRASELAGTPDDITLDTHAAALATLGRFDEAVGVIKQAIEIAPASDVSAYTERLQMYLRKEAFLSQPFGMVESASFEGKPCETSTH